MSGPANPPPLKRGDLDAHPCDNCVGKPCEHLTHSDGVYVIACPCNPHGGLEVMYRDGVLILGCMRCKWIVAHISVAT